MPAIGGLPVQAGGNIGPCLFVTADTSADNQVLQASAGTQAILGITPEDTPKLLPGLSGQDITIAYQANDEVMLYTVGMVAMLFSGAAITAGALLKSNASGQGVTATAAGTDEVGALALEAATGSGIKIKVLVLSRKL